MEEKDILNVASEYFSEELEEGNLEVFLNIKLKYYKSAIVGALADGYLKAQKEKQKLEVIIKDDLSELESFGITVKEERTKWIQTNGKN